MYLHLGENQAILSEEIIGIFDLERASLQKDTRAFLAYATKQKQVVTVSCEMPKAFVVTAPPDGTLYVTAVSSDTLKKRATLRTSL